MNDLFFELIRLAIGISDSLSHTPSQKEWIALYDMAKKQSLVGVCFAGLQKLGANADEGFSKIGMSEMLYLTWMGMAAKIQLRNEVVNQQCRDLASRFKGDGIEYCIMKGQQVGRYYGDLSMLRQSGDIDIWMKGGMKRVVEYVQKISPTRSMSHQHVHLKVFDDTSVEMHYLPAELHCPWYDKRLKNYLESNSQFVVINGNSYLNGVSVPSDVFNIIHLIAHAFRHLLGEGMTIRQLMDLYFVLLSWDGSGHDKIQIVKSLEECGLLKYTEALMYAMKDILCLDDSKMLCEPKARRGELLISLIMDSTNTEASLERRKNGTQESAYARFVRVSWQNLRLFGFAPMEIIWTPLWRVYNWSWMKIHGYKYCD